MPDVWFVFLPNHLTSQVPALLYRARSGFSLGMSCVSNQKLLKEMSSSIVLNNNNRKCLIVPGKTWQMGKENKADWIPAPLEVNSTGPLTGALLTRRYSSQTQPKPNLWLKLWAQSWVANGKSADRNRVLIETIPTQLRDIIQVS